MAKLMFLVVVASFILVFYYLYRHSVKQRQSKFIDDFLFPARLNTKLADQYPHLTDQQIEEVIRGLREYFHICHLAGRKVVSMPSQAVDTAWHEFILFTRKYEIFCYKALGRFLHHTPAEAMSSPTLAQQGIRKAWRISCGRENISPDSPNKLPLLFAMDAALDIPDGFKYSLNCKDKNISAADSYCASHIGCSSDGCSGGCSGDSSGCGGCGGD